MEINSLGNSYEDATLFEVILVLCSNSNIISEQRFWLKPWHYVLQEFWYISMPFNKIDLPESKFRITRSHLYDCRIFWIKQRRNIGWYRKNWQWRPCLPLACSIQHGNCTGNEDSRDHCNFMQYRPAQVQLFILDFLQSAIKAPIGDEIIF